MVGHRMTRDMAADTLPADVLLRYLVYEHGFVETAVTIFGYALVKAPGIAEQTRLAAALQGLTTDQLAWFRRVFDALGVSDDQRVVADPPPAVSAFRDGMLSLAVHGTYEEILAGMAAAEWMYLTWSRTAHAHRPSDPVCGEWIALHVAPPFTDQVDWLLDELDRSRARSWHRRGSTSSRLPSGARSSSRSGSMTRRTRRRRPGPAMAGRAHERPVSARARAGEYVDVRLRRQLVAVVRRSSVVRRRLFTSVPYECIIFVRRT